MLDQGLERGEDLLVGQVAGRPEKDQGVGVVQIQSGVSLISASLSSSIRFKCDS